MRPGYHGCATTLGLGRKARMAVNPLETSLGPRRAISPWPAVLFVVLAAAGIFIAKWDPYFAKVFQVAGTHTLGPSIVTGTHRAAPPVGLAAAVSYAVAYLKDIWIAFIVGLVVAAGVESLLPEGWLVRLLGRATWGSATLAAAAAVPSMMCTCCSAPIAVSLKRQRVSNGAVFAYWVGNPVLNPATIVFMGFVLGWNWALLRIIMGILLVAGAAYIGNRWAHDDSAQAMRSTLDLATRAPLPRTARFFRALGRLTVSLIPEYVVIVGALGAVRAWLFPALGPGPSDSILLFFGLAIAGTLFVIPTAGEIPIVSSLLSYGLSTMTAGALLMTLPAVSLPSMAMVSQAVAKPDIARLAVLVLLVGLLTGVVAHFVI
jgi:uncharacterized membrane protein YraQ (UPF0718 family)